MCPKEFKQKSHLKTHMKNVHQTVHREDNHLLQRVNIHQNVTRRDEIHPTQNSYLGESSRVRAMEERLRQLEAQVAALLA